MALLVQKFGGTSVATQAHINHAADIVAKAKHAGHDVVVVVSAMSGETDKLINLAHQMSESPDPREYAVLVSTGEQVSIALMAMALINRGIQARSYTGGQARILTSGQYKKARIEAIDTQPILEDLKQGNVVVVAGFQGVDKDGNITTLGRGGSDTTAVALAAALKADECQIYTDVDGVYTTDPRVVPEAQRLDQVTFEEMLELSSLGAKVLQIRSVEFAGKFKVPLRVLSSSKEGPGTLITSEKEARMESFAITGIAFSRNEAKICLNGIPDGPGVASSLLAELSTIGVSVDMILQHSPIDSLADFSFTVHQDEYKPTYKLLSKLATKLNAKGVKGFEHLAKLSLVGAGLKSHPEVAPMMFKVLADQDINIQLITSSEIKLSVIIDESRLDDGVRALHQAFHLEAQAMDESRKMAI
ncbi:aspartate kinase [Legionella impletisoli]|uniref:Aspartokinase n=3 Tax=Bacteria TaxID=2 RepID=A0A917JQ23_9GAMM|nr:aspartate kinase [Legionella impletisoli]GGI79472.1 aspartokinase [Legionella impletisoli]